MADTTPTVPEPKVFDREYYDMVRGLMKDVV